MYVFLSDTEMQARKEAKLQNDRKEKEKKIKHMHPREKEGKTYGSDPEGHIEKRPH